MNKFTLKKDLLINEIKWCLGCGNYSIIVQLSRLFEKLKINKKKTIIISGIGCSSRLPYYMKLNNYHTIHGRAFSIATGIKLTNYKYKIWIITGDGDAFSIGLNHLLHTIRRNININILIFNNGVYALTKGNLSYTNFNNKFNFNIIYLILSAGATFIARTLDSNPKHLRKILYKANKYKGTSCVEIIQNCPIYNNIKNKNNNKIFLKNKKPLIFSKNKCITLLNNIFNPKIKIKNLNTLKNNNNIWYHDQNNNYKAFLLSQFNSINKKLPIPFGIFYKIKIKKKISKIKKKKLKLLKLYKKNFIF
ncbi:MAG: thiamine pyrophosphate-dependent enzyme [Candidatus Shikimatogenerans bostrichidophilus]|nr:MAG: thiamine pyrophosphate-dependent enzyme [Candidatus Shikimatogenerans bostrichidophilus]